MKTTARRSLIIIVLVVAVVAGLAVLGVRFATNGEKWATLRANEHLTEDGSFIAAGNVTDRNGEILAHTENEERVYNESERVRRSTLHIVGDTEGYISSGVQTAYKTRLTGYSPVTGLYSLKKYGRGNDVSLTIDSQVCAMAYDCLKGRNGVVAAYNYETGELLCSVSSPNYDIENKPSAEEIDKNTNGKYDGIYLNRLVDGLYTPGSVFKIITTTSAVENIPNLDSWTYTCTGEEIVGGVKVTCPKVHGKMDFEEAFANSCNGAFAVISKELGNEKLSLTANEFRFGKSFAFGNSLTDASIFDVTGANSGDLAWASVGQYTTLVNPYHMLTVLGAVANDGEAVYPYAVSTVTSPSGKIVQKTKAESEAYIAPEVANKVESMMRNNVKSVYGDSKFEGLSMCGKTGTAEIADGSKPHSWFAGFSQNPQCPVAIVVVVENGGWGSSAALPIASKVMEAVYKTLS